jgi:hypothetical protein
MTVSQDPCLCFDFQVIIQGLGPVAQSVEQRIENPCVGGSIPPRATSIHAGLREIANPHFSWFVNKVSTVFNFQHLQRVKLNGFFHVIWR